MKKNRPHILFIMADQMNPFYTPPYGGKSAIMPALKTLAAEGTVFTSAYCNSPLCAPSRASMMSGKLISSLKCAFDNASEFSSEVPTFAHLFKAAGYRTVLSGKMHFIGSDQLHGFEERLTTDIYPADFSWTPEGWDLPTPSHSNYRNILKNNNSSEWNLQIQYDEEVHFRAKEKLRELSGSEQPFFMTVSYTHPHTPFQAMAQYQKMYENIVIDLSDIAVPENRDEYNEYLARDMHFDIPLADEDIIRNRRNYLGMLSYVDNKIEELLAVLKCNGMLDNTIIVFTSDHGEMLGKQGMWEKRTFLEGASRIPLIFTGPGITAGTVKKPVSLLDLYPTFIDILEIDWPDEYLDGESFIDALKGKSLPDSRYSINEYYGECIKYPFRSIIKGKYKLVHFPEHDQHDLLYNLEADPDETFNIIADKTIEAIKDELYDMLLKEFDYAELKEQINESREQRKLILKAEKSAAYKTDWNFHPASNANSKYVR